MARVRRDNDARYALRASFVDPQGDVIKGDTITIGAGEDPTDVAHWNEAYSWGNHAAAGYASATGYNNANWDTAYGWGNHASAGYASLAVDENVTGTWTFSNKGLFACPDGILVQSSNAWPLEVRQGVAGTDAMMSFHVAGDYAVNFGLDGSNNKLSVGGWSMAANSYAIYHEGNPQTNITGNAATCTRPYVNDYNGAATMRVLGSHDGIASYGNVYGNAGITMNMSTDVLAAGGGFAVGGNSIYGCTGDYGSFTVTGLKNGWGGINVNNRLVLMNNNGTLGGLFNDVNNQWILHYTENADCRLYYAAAQRLATSAAGVTISGALTATGNVTAYSDERLKSDIKTLDGSKVYEMRGVSFIKDGEESSGVIAQEMQKVAPELVMEGEEYLSVAYGNLVGYLIEAVKDLKAEVDELKRNK